MRHRIVGFLGGGGGPAVPNTDYYRMYRSEDTITTFPASLLEGQHDFTLHVMLYVSLDYDPYYGFYSSNIFQDLSGTATGSLLQFTATTFLSRPDGYDTTFLVQSESSAGTSMDHRWDVPLSPGEWHHITLRGISATQQFNLTLSTQQRTRNYYGAMPYPLGTVTGSYSTRIAGGEEQGGDDVLQCSGHRLYVGADVGTEPSTYIHQHSVPGYDLRGIRAYSSLTAAERIGLVLAVESIEGIPTFGSEFSDLTGNVTTTGGNANNLQGVKLKTFTKEADLDPALPVSGLAATLTGGTVEYTIQNFLSFDAEDEYRNTFTYATFVRFSSLTGEIDIITGGMSNSVFTFQMTMVNGKIRVQYGTNNVVCEEGSLVANEWAFVCFVNDRFSETGNREKLYINGVEVYNDAVSTGGLIDIIPQDYVKYHAPAGVSIAGMKFHHTVDWSSTNVNQAFFQKDSGEIAMMTADHVTPSVPDSKRAMTIAVEAVAGFPLPGEELISVKDGGRMVDPIVVGATLVGAPIEILIDVLDTAPPATTPGTYPMANLQSSTAQARELLVDGDSEWSVMLWVYNIDLISGNFMEETQEDTYSWSMGTTNAGGGLFRYTASATQNNGTTVNITSTNTFSTATEPAHQVTLTYSVTGGSMDLYIDGVLEGTATVSQAMRSEDEATSVAASIADVDVAGLRKWSRSLSITEIPSYRIYNGTTEVFDIIAEDAFLPAQLVDLDLAVEFGVGVPGAGFELQDQVSVNHFNAATTSVTPSTASMGFSITIADTLAASFTGASKLTADTNITTSTNMTMNIWVNLNSIATEQGIFTIDDPDDVGNRGASISYDPAKGGLVARVVTASGTDEIIHPFIDVADYHMLTLTHSSTGIAELYVDGVSVGSVAASGAISATGLDAVIGAFSGATPKYYTGNALMAYIGTTVWSSTEVVANYNAAVIPAFSSMSQVVFDDALFFWNASVYPLDIDGALDEQVSGVADMVETGTIAYESTSDFYTGARVAAFVVGNKVIEDGNNKVIEDGNNSTSE